jgi:hypothetical protein
MAEQTRAYEEVAGETFPTPTNVAATVQLDYEQAKPYLSNKPLRRPARTSLCSPAPTYERLRELAARHKPPQEWHDEPMGSE